jgi:hypothetical protein
MVQLKYSPVNNKSPAIIHRSNRRARLCNKKKSAKEKWLFVIS